MPGVERVAGGELQLVLRESERKKEGTSSWDGHKNTAEARTRKDKVRRNRHQNDSRKGEPGKCVSLEKVVGKKWGPLCNPREKQMSQETKLGSTEEKLLPALAPKDYER